jgi:glycosyltransferase involved in cell wall biosynthesis
MNKNNKKILYLADTYQFHSRRWINYFIKKGHDVYVINTRRKKYPIENCRIFEAGRLPLLFQLILTVWLIWKIKPHILHAHNVTRTGWLGAMSGFHPFVLTPWGSDLFIDARKNAFYGLMGRYSLKKADLITCDSEALKKEAVRLGARVSSIEIIYWGIDLDLFHPGYDTAKLRTGLNIGDKRVVFSGRHFFPKYNILTIVKAIPLILQENRNIAFILKTWGKDPAYTKQIHDMVKDLGVEKNVMFLGEIDLNEMPYYYNLATVYISVPFSDSMPASIFEAMACGCVPVLSDLESTRELIEQDINGIIVPAEDHRMLADAVVKVISDGELRQKINKHNSDLVREKGCQSRWFDKMEGLYRKLIK